MNGGVYENVQSYCSDGGGSRDRHRCCFRCCSSVRKRQTAAKHAADISDRETRHVDPAVVPASMSELSLGANGLAVVRLRSTCFLDAGARCFIGQKATEYVPLGRVFHR